MNTFFDIEIPRMAEVMVDCESLAVSNKSPLILSIGACMFDMQRLQIGQSFYANVSMQSCIDLGLTIDGSTVAWWFEQEESARLAVLKDTKPLAEVLQAFSAWLDQHAVEMKGRCVWSNGAAEDCAWLNSAYNACKLETPWMFWGVRCFRTVKALYPNIERDQVRGVKHNALDDAVSQAEHLFKIRRTLRGQA